MPVEIRPIRKGDHDEWAALFAAYAVFYKVEQTPDMRATVWNWLVDPDKEFEGFVALADTGKLVGIAHFRPFFRPLRATIAGYLDDLFVSPEARGSGVADGLIEAVRAEGARRGWAIIRWVTADNNYRARSVYDRRAERTGFITYDLDV